MFQIKDETLKRLILLHLNDIQEQGDQSLDALLAGGIDADLLDLLRHRPARDFSTAARMGQLVIKVVIDSSATAACFRQVDSMRSDHELCEYFVRHGAPDTVLAHLFKLSRHEGRRLRNLLTPGARPPGPPKVLTPGDSRLVHADWAQVRRSHPQASLRDWLYHLHLIHPQHSFHQIWATLEQFGSVPVLRAEVR
jgi:hypothetical protein